MERGRFDQIFKYFKPIFFLLDLLADAFQDLQQMRVGAYANGIYVFAYVYTIALYKMLKPILLLAQALYKVLKPILLWASLTSNPPLQKLDNEIQKSINFILFFTRNIKK